MSKLFSNFDDTRESRVDDYKDLNLDHKASDDIKDQAMRGYVSIRIWNHMIQSDSPEIKRSWKEKLTELGRA